jgi:hypothetical protein
VSTAAPPTSEDVLDLGLGKQPFDDRYGSFFQGPGGSTSDPYDPYRWIHFGALGAPEWDTLGTGLTLATSGFRANSVVRFFQIISTNADMCIGIIRVVDMLR